MNIINREFTATGSSATDILQKSNQFYIPIYQRAYTWQHDVEVKQLIEDLEDFYKRLAGKNKSYYIGNIIIKKATVGEIKQNIDVVVDGQQRITTITLIILHLLKSTKKFKKEIESKYSKEAYENLYYHFSSMLYINGTNEKRIKISNGESNSWLNRLFGFGGSSKEFEKTNYYKNYKYITKTIKINNVSDITKWKEILEKVKFVWVLLADDDDEISIFETINSKGKPLNVKDLIKNYLFLLSERFGTSDDDKNDIDKIMSDGFQKHFPNIDKLTGERAVNKFFAAMLIEKTNKHHSSYRDEIYKAFKETYGSSIKSNEDLLNVVREIESSLKLYGELKEEADKFENTSHNNKEFNYALSNLASSKLDMYLPLFIRLHKEKELGEIETDEYNDFVEFLDFYNIVLLINKSNKNNKIVPMLLEKVKPMNTENFLNYINSKKDDSRIPDSATFMDRFIHTDMFLNNKKVLRYILFRIENNLISTNEKIQYKKWTLEHIIPQKGSKWRKNISNYELNHPKNIHRIGNFTLTKDNTTLSNDNYETKLKIFKKSSIHITKELISDYPDNFEIGDSDINNNVLLRGKKLYKQFLDSFKHSYLLK